MTRSRRDEILNELIEDKFLPFSLKLMRDLVTSDDDGNSKIVDDHKAIAAFHKHGMHRFVNDLEDFMTQRNSACDYFLYLNNLPPSELRKLYNNTFAHDDAVANERDAELDEMRFFNEPDSSAEIAYWRQIPVWSADEAVALSFGKDPRVVNRENMHGPASVFKKDYRLRAELVRRGILAGDLSDPVRSEDFLNWSHRVGINYDPILEVVAGRFLRNELSDLRERIDDLTRENNELKAKISRQTNLDTEPKDSDQSIRNIYRLILGIAVSRYGYKLNSKNNAVTNIQNSLEKLEGLDAEPFNRLGRSAITGNLERAVEALQISDLRKRVD